MEITVGQLQSADGTLLFSPTPGVVFIWRHRARSAASTFGLHDACNVFERAADSLHRARINTKLLGNYAHACPTQFGFLAFWSATDLKRGE